MAGSVFKRCGCRDAQGRKLGEDCPRLRTTGHGAWYYKAELTSGPVGERRRARKGGFATRKDAERALTELLDQVNRGTHVDAGKQTLGEYLESWLAGRRNLRPTTVKSYREHLDLYLLPVLGHVLLGRLDEYDVDRLLATLDEVGIVPLEEASPELAAVLKARRGGQAAQPLATSSRLRVCATLRKALNDAVKRRLIARNPCAHVDLPKPSRPRPVLWNPARTDEWRHWRDEGARLHEALLVAERRLRRPPRGSNVDELAASVHAAQAAVARHRASYAPPAVAVWTPAQTGQFLDAIETHRLYALFHLLAFSGLRRGEAVGLPWTNVDLEAATLDVTTQIVQLGYAVATVPPKADSVGTLALAGNCVEALLAHRSRQDAEARAAGTAWQPSGLVFCHEDGSPLHPEYVSRTFERLVEKADLPPIRLHDLRHGAATLGIAAGVGLKVISAMLRHSSITITADTYSTVLPDTARQAAEAAAALVPRSSTSSGGA